MVGLAPVHGKDEAVGVTGLSRAVPQWRASAINRFDGMRTGMAADPMNPTTAVTWGPFIQAAYEQFASDPGQVNPAAIKNIRPGTRWCARFR